MCLSGRQEGKSAADLRMLRLPSDHWCGANAVMGLVAVFLGENRCRSIVQVLKNYFGTPVDGEIPGHTHGRHMSHIQALHSKSNKKCSPIEREEI